MKKEHGKDKNKAGRKQIDKTSIVLSKTQSSLNDAITKISNDYDKREQTLWLSQERSLCEQEDRNDRDATARYNSDVQAASIKYHSDTATLTAQQQNETREITNRHQHQKQEEEARHKREFRELHHRRREVQIVTPAAGGFGRENTPASLGRLWT